MTIDEKNQNANQAIDVRFEQLKAVWKEHEAMLKAMRPIMPVQCCYSSEPRESDGDCDKYYLGFWKQGGDWQISHGYRFEPYQDEINWTPIHETSIIYRVKAAYFIDMLREKIVASKEKFIPEMDGAITTLANALRKRH